MPPPTTTFHVSAATIPAASGSYVLVMALDRPVTIALPGRATTTLPPGRYLYCGSARGPGGLKARLARHMRADKTMRWHIDRLTIAGKVLGAWIFAKPSECDLVAMLSGLSMPLPGFGASDCRRCSSHLLAWPDGTPADGPTKMMKMILGGFTR